MNYIYMALGGILGVWGRFLVGGAVFRWLKLGPPYGTLIVNVSGCLLIGFFATLAEVKGSLGPGARSFIFIGFLGAYTTFSTFMFESFALIDQSRLAVGLGNVLLSVTLGYLSLALGVVLGKTLA